MRRGLALALSVFLFTMSVAASAAVKVPQWLLDEASRPLPSYPPETEAVVLLEEQMTVVSPEGSLLTTCRRATMVLRPGGVDEARRLVLYEAFSVKVRSMTGWVVNPNGEPRQTTMKHVITSSLAPDTLYMDAKLLLLILPEVDSGSVVGFEWKEEHTPLSLEDGFQIQGSFPVLRAHYSMYLPMHWAAELHEVNWSFLESQHGLAGPQRAINIEIADIPAVVDEPFRPHESALAGRLLVRIIPPEKDPRAFAGWTDMGAWYDGLSRQRRAPDASTSAKASALAAQAASALDKIRFLADFVQKQIRYVSIQIGIGGFQPHYAKSILANRYGDCKDKATLLSALLQAIGFESYPVIVHTARGFVNPDSPVSLYSFNHVILAIRLPEDVPDDGLDGLIRHLRLGRLLIFDPTMPTTPLGRLPFYLQDNTGLLVADGGGELIELPRAKPESNMLDRTGRLVLKSDGTLVGEIQEKRRGFLADSLRYHMQAASEADRQKYLETFLSYSVSSFSLRDYEFRHLDSASEDLLVSYRFIAPSYAKRAGSFLVVRPCAVGQKAVDLTSQDKRPRRYPIDLETTIVACDEFIIELPKNCVVEALPEPVAINAGFATYKSTVETADGRLVYRREYRLMESLLPASRFEQALKFFLAVAAEEQQSVLLKMTE